MSKPLNIIAKGANKNDLVKIVLAASNPRRKGGPYRIGFNGAMQRFDKRAKAQALHDHYQTKQAQARRARLQLPAIKQ